MNWFILMYIKKQMQGDSKIQNADQREPSNINKAEVQNNATHIVKLLPQESQASSLNAYLWEITGSAIFRVSVGKYDSTRIERWGSCSTIKFGYQHKLCLSSAKYCIAGNILLFNWWDYLNPLA